MPNLRLSLLEENHLEPPNPLTTQVALPNRGGGEWRGRAGEGVQAGASSAASPSTQCLTF